jgi:asparaginyl-tRNA synthetase
MQEEGFVESFYPGITNATGSCESIGNVFVLKLDKFLTLSQTAQLYMEGELVKSDLPRMYTLSRSFRKDVAGDGRHLQDFALLEYEALDTNLDWLLEFNERLLARVIQDLLRSNFLSRRQVNRLYSFWRKGFKRMPYTEAVDFLKVEWGSDLGREQEHALTEEFGMLQVTHYPREIKFFNMLDTRKNGAANGRHTVDCVDVLLPGAGESIGGSAREHDYKILTQKLKESMMLKQLKNLKHDHDGNGHEVDHAFVDYLDLFKDNVIPRSGAGLGLGRFLQFLLGEPEVVHF